jgi:hypothetical protein
VCVCVYVVLRSARGRRMSLALYTRTPTHPHAHRHGKGAKDWAVTHGKEAGSFISSTSKEVRVLTRGCVHFVAARGARLRSAGWGIGHTRAPPPFSSTPFF